MSSNKTHSDSKSNMGSSEGDGGGSGTECTNYVSHFDSVVAVHYLVLIHSHCRSISCARSPSLCVRVCLTVCVDLTTVYVFKADV